LSELLNDNNHKYDIMCLTETLLKPDIMELKLREYDFHRLDRLHKGWGGIGVLIRKEYSSEIYNLPSSSDIQQNLNTESLTIKVKLGHNKAFLVTCIYRAPSYNLLDLERDSSTFELIVGDLVRTNRDFFILGDFNLALPKHYKHFKSIMTQYSLKQLITCNTRGNSILDLIITNKPQLVYDINVFDPHISDHCATEATIIYKRPERVKKVISYRNFRDMNNEQFMADIHKAPLQSNTNSLESLISTFNTEIIRVYDIHAPFINKQIVINRTSNKKLLSQNTLSLKQDRDKAYKQYKQTNAVQDKECFQALNKSVKQAIHKDTKSDINQQIHEKGIFPTINSFCKLNKKREVTFNIDENDINKYFAEVSTGNQVIQKYPTKPNDIITPEQEFRVREIEIEELLETWNTLKKRNSTVYDVNLMCPRMLRLAISNETAAEAVLNIVNSSISAGTMSNSLKISKVIPLAKMNKPESPSDLRPISIQPLMGKIIEKVVNRQVVAFTNENHIFNPNQFGFRAKHSTVHAQIALTDHLFAEIDKGNVCILISLDLRKAFDKVNRELILHKLGWYNINTHWFESYLKDRSQYVHHNDRDSDKKSTDLGVPQGSINGPYLFSILINDLPYHIKEGLTLLFADDTNITISGAPDNIAKLVERVSSCMERVIEWMDSNLMELNIDKTQMVVIGIPRVVRSIGTVTVKVKHIEIKSTNCIKSLGLLIDSELTWAHHIGNVTRNCNSVLWSLYPIQRMLTQVNRKLVLNAYILSKLRYMCPIWGSATKACKKKVEAVLRKAGRYVLSLQKYDKVKYEMSNLLMWLFPDNMYQYEILKLAYSILAGNCPPYFNKYLDFSYIPTRVTRNKTYYQTSLSNLRSNTSYGYKSFKFVATTLWLNLPTNAAEAQEEFMCDLQSMSVSQSLPVFKKTLKRMYLDRQMEESAPREEDHPCNYSCIDSVVNFVLEDS